MNRRNTILIVDDMEVNRVILRSIFEKEYELLEAKNGEQAMMLVEQYHYEIAAVLLDIVMPVKDGYQVLSGIGNKGYLTEFPVIVITAKNSAENEVRSFDMGASDIIVKPFEPHVVKRRVQNNIELNQHRQNQLELIEDQASRLRESNAVMIDVLSSIIEYRSVETGQHIHCIRMFTKVLLEDVSCHYPEFMLNERNIEIIVSASSMHDIGKIAIPDAILNKPGRLTKEEFEIMKTHSVKGSEMISQLSRMTDKEYLKYAYNICRYHHERWDGTGYPDHLQRDNIPVCAQVVGIADCYDALTTDRVYKKAIRPEQALAMILNGECGVFSPKLLESLKNVQAVFAHLSQEYSDNLKKQGAIDSPEQKHVSEPEDRTDSGMLDTLRMGQLKYFTLLKYLDDTVMEVDLITGLYHIVYTSGHSFDALKTGKSFSESIRNFTTVAVHPDDRAMVLELLGDYMRTFFREGMTKQSRQYRVYNRFTQKYIWCQATVLRIDTEQPYQRKVMLIWKADIVQPERCVTVHAENTLLMEMFGGIQVLRNDRWQTMSGLCEYLQHLLGYTAEECRERFQNRYINLIQPFDQKEMIQQMKKQLLKGTFVEMEYPVMARNGHIFWLLDKRQLVMQADGKEYFYCILTDVTQFKKDQEELRRLSERHRLIMEQTNDIIFEWDIAQDRIICSSNDNQIFGHRQIMEMARTNLDESFRVYPEDYARFLEFFNHLKQGRPYEKMDLRMAERAGLYRWYRIQAAAQFDETGKAYKVIAVATDVDEEKQKLFILRDQAERDGLTRLYNRNTAKKSIEMYLQTRQIQSLAAMIIIDVDDFKHINDTYGHMFGDVVLQEISRGMQQLVRSKDVVSRIGGDEFLLFMGDIPGRAIAEKRARKVLDIFRKMKWNTTEECRVSCSLGIAFCPDDGQRFEELFHHSDQALYYAKAQGKEGFRIFDKNIMADDVTMPKIAANTRIDSEKGGTDRNFLIDEVFRCLYETPDVVEAVASILEMAGRHFGVSRVYIFENSHDGASAFNTFEWCNQDTPPLKSVYPRLVYGGWEKNYQESFNHAGVFYCPDTRALPVWQKQILAVRQVKSVLQYAIQKNGVFRGFVGFDDCIIQRFWLKEQMDILAFIVRLTAALLLKK